MYLLEAHCFFFRYCRSVLFCSRRGDRVYLAMHSVHFSHISAFNFNFTTFISDSGKRSLLQVPDGNGHSKSIFPACIQQNLPKKISCVRTSTEDLVLLRVVLRVFSSDKEIWIVWNSDGSKWLLWTRYVRKSLYLQNSFENHFIYSK